MKHRAPRRQAGNPRGLADRDPAGTGELKKDEAKALLGQHTEKLAELQELLWANDSCALLVIFQGMDGAGKDSATKHVLSGVNPQGVQVVSFKQPSPEELEHDFLWRVSKSAPSAAASASSTGRITKRCSRCACTPSGSTAGAVRVGPRPAVLGARYEDINAFERHLDSCGTKIVKFSSTSRRRSRSGASSSGSTVRTRSGSSTRTTSPSRRTGTSTWPRTKTRSARRRRSGRRGT